jgi:hypothetical protein
VGSFDQSLQRLEELMGDIEALGEPRREGLPGFVTIEVEDDQGPAHRTRRSALLRIRDIRGPASGPA